MDEKDDFQTETLTLGPKVVLNELNIKYINKLEELLLLDDCKNIAIIGNYGSGKSSLIKSFFDFKKEYEEKSLTVAIGSYIVDKDIPTNPDHEINSKEQILVNRVEESILKQIMYRKKSSKFPKSSLIRIDKEPWYKELSYGIMILYSICFCIFYYYKYFKKSILSIEKLNELFGINGWIMLCITMYLIFKIVRVIINKVKVNKIKIKDCEFELHSESNSLFSKYLSEIIYYFQITKCNLVIFEDLDRFPNDVALKVIQELKELNTILNNAYAIDKVVFIYAVKDNLFDTVQDKNKFYDYNLSLLPISTAFNSELNLIGLLKKQNVYEDLSSKVIGIISKNIYDMRTLINIVNDYCLFKEITNTKNNDKLFAMVAFKNYYYREYNLIFEGTDIIKEAFSSSIDKRNSLIEELNKDKELIIEQINKIENDILNNCKELKETLLAHNIYINGNNNYAIDYYYISGRQEPISKFLDENFDMSQLENNEFELRRNGTRISETSVFEQFGSKKEFIERYNSLSNNNKITELQKAKEEKNAKVSSIKLLSANEIFKEYFKLKDIKSNDSNQLLYDLIKNNYITEDYMDYITSPVIFENNNDSESLMYSDSEFLMNFRQQKYSFDIKLTGFKTIMNIINDDLDSPYILNYDLLYYLIKHKEEKYLNKIFMQFEKTDYIKLRFILIFLQKNTDMCDFVFTKFEKNKYDIWQPYIDNENDFSVEDGKFLFIKMLYYPEYIKHINDLDSLQIFFENIFMKEDNNKINEIIDNENVKISILLIHPRIDEIKILNQKNYDFAYENNLYSFTKNNINKITQKEKFDFKTLKTDSKNLLLYNYIRKNLKNFCEEYYINNDAKFDDAELLIKVIFDKNISISTKKIVFEREKFKLKTIDNIENELYEFLILYNHLNIRWKNIIDLYKEVNDDLLFEYTTNNLNKLIGRNIPNDNLQKNSLFFNDYCMYLIKVDLNNAEKILQLSSPKYEQVDNLTKEQIVLLEKYNCLIFNKSTYKYICKILSQEERYGYILNCFNSEKTLTEILNLISFEDLELLLKYNEVNNDKKISLIYGMYKKEKRADATIAYNNFIVRMKIAFNKNEIHKISYNRTIYDAILRKIKQQGIFKVTNITEEIIEFKIE